MITILILNRYFRIAILLVNHSYILLPNNYFNDSIYKDYYFVTAISLILILKLNLFPGLYILFCVCTDTVLNYFVYIVNIQKLFLKNNRVRFF